MKLYLPRTAWWLLVFLVLLLIYGLVPSVENAVNAAVGAFFGPIIDMLTLAANFGG